MQYTKIVSLDPEHQPPNQFETETATQYLSQQRDPMIGSQTKRVQITDEKEFWHLSSSLPIEFKIPKKVVETPIDWTFVPENESQGHALWKYSAGYLPTLFESSGDYDLIERILNSLLAFTDSELWTETSEWMTSLDHCLATRVRAITTLSAQFHLDELPLPQSARQLLANDMANLVIGRNKYFPSNNHGAMAAVSLIHGAAIHPWVSQHLDSLDLPDPLSIGWQELWEVLDSVFDDCGLASENSPEYQRFWIALLEPVVSFVDLFPSSADTASVRSDKELRELLDDAETALSVFVDGNSRMLPIGDSHPRTVRDPMKVEGVFYYKDNGFAVVKSPISTFSFNCGSTNYAHKHCDDTSITLEYNGQNMIVDSGFYSHDWNDAKGIFAKSQNAHSGLFLTGLDNLHPGKVHFPGRERVKATLEQLSEPRGQEGTVFAGNYLVDDRSRLTRQVQALGPGAFDLEDRVEGDIDGLGHPLARFIIPSGYEISVDRHNIRIFFPQNILELSFDNGELDVKVRIHCAAEEPEIKGWISPELRKLDPAYCIEAPFPKNSVLRTKIRVL